MYEFVVFTWFQKDYILDASRLHYCHCHCHLSWIYVHSATTSLKSIAHSSQPLTPPNNHSLNPQSLNL